MPISLRLSAFLIVAGALSPAYSQAPDADVVAKIRDEGMNHSQVMQTMSYLCDVIGPRLTASPSMKRANEWTRDKLTSWGLQNAHLEAWGPFGRGWQLDGFFAQVVAPQDIPLIAYPKAWSPSLRGPVTADVVLVDATDEAGLAKFKGHLRGKIVMSGDERPVPARFTSQGTRYTDAQLLAMTEPQAPRQRGGGGPGGAPGGPGAAGQTDAQRRAFADRRAQAQFGGTKLRFFMEEGALAVLDGSRGDDGTLFVQSASVPTPPPAPVPVAVASSGTPGAPAVQAPQPRTASVWDKSAPKTLPQVTVSSEQYNRMARMIHQGESLRMQLQLNARFFDRDLMGYNTVAEIPGSDLKDQVVMVGGHMDSWHSGTGATDNGAGVVVAMEAVRILKALNLQPRRTVRVALWSGEEEGLFGSRNYVASHFGGFSGDGGPNGPYGGGGGGGAARARGPLEKKPEYDKLSVYFNLDNGTGKIRGIYQQGNEQVGPIFADWFKPFADLGASTLTLRNTGSTDHVSFDAIGIPGFQFIQDTIEYDTRTHHSNQDVVDRIQVDDLKQAAIIMASFLYNAANRDEMMPRKALAAPGQ